MAIICGLKSFERAYERYDKSKGLLVLEFLSGHPSGCTQKEISENLMHPKQSINLTVRLFKEAGCLELSENTVDRRNKRIAFTEKGGDTRRMWLAL